MVWWLAKQDGSAVVRDRRSDWECRFRLFSRDIGNHLLKTNGWEGRGRQEA